MAKLWTRLAVWRTNKHPIIFRITAAARSQQQQAKK
jgi:hypothetical protein